MKKQTAKTSFAAYAANSFILSQFYRFAVFLYQKIEESCIGRFFCSYDKEEKTLREGMFGKTAEKAAFSTRILRPLRFRIAAQFDHSTILCAIRQFADRLAALPLSTYGFSCLFFSLISCIVFLIRFFITHSVSTASAGITANIEDIIVPAAALFIGICFIGSHKHLNEALCQSCIMNFLLFRIAGAREEYFRSLPQAAGSTFAASISGIVLGLATIVVDAYFIPLAIVGMIGLLIFYKIPEFGVIFLLFALPFLPTMALVGLMMILFGCFLLKYLRGKRIIQFGWIDLCVLMFAVVLFLAGICSASPADSVFHILVFTCFLCGYFLVVNLLRTDIWISRALFAILSSTTLVSLYGVYQNFFGGAATTWQDTDMFSEITGRVVSTFENPNVLAEYLIMCMPIAVACFFCSQKVSLKLSCLFVCGISGSCLIFTWSRGAWLGFLFAMMLFLFMYSQKTLVFMLFGLLAVPFLPFVLPENIVNRFLSIGNLADSSTSYRVHIWEGAWRMLQDYLFGGIGAGVDVFQKIYPRYSLSAIESAPHSHNLYLQILVETGIFGLLLFLLFLFTYAKHTFTIYQKPTQGSKRTYMAAAFCGTLAILAQGMTDYIWYNYRVYLMFWLMIGVTVAIGKTAAADNRVMEKPSSASVNRISL